jgi:protein-L-isoaspartate(D-aspartate) O-methyltransferase
MKTSLLLVLSMVAVAWEATAQDAQCVRERAAMVETIRAYAGSDASVLGQQGLSERVLEAMGKRNAICSSLSDLAPSHTRTARFR